MSTTIILGAHGDDDQSRDGLALAVALARTMGAELLVAGVWASPLGAGDALYESAVRDQLKAEVRRLRDAVPGDVFARSRIVGSTGIVRGLHHLVEHEEADLLVVGPHHPGGARGAHPDVALRVLHDAPCAVAVAPAGHRERMGGPLGDVVVGWDGSAESEQALELAVDLAARAGSAVRLVAAVEPPFTYATKPWADKKSVEHWSEVQAEGARESLQEATRRVAGRVPTDTHIVEGTAAEALAEAGAAAGLVVMGSRRHGSIRRLVVGSTSADLLHRGGVPMLVVPRGVTVREPADAHAAG